jgi:hypothetical protein
MLKRMENISWTHLLKNEGVLHRFREDRNIPPTMKRRKTTWIGRTCLLKHVIGGKIEGRTEVTERQEIRRDQLLVCIKETRRYCKWKEKELIELSGKVAWIEAMNISFRTD